MSVEHLLESSTFIHLNECSDVMLTNEWGKGINLKPLFILTLSIIVQGNHVWLLGF